VQLRQAELLGVLDEHDRGVGHVHADLDERRGQQRVNLPRAKGGHDRLLLPRRQPPVQQAHPVGCQRLPQRRVFAGDGLEAAGAGVFHARVNNIRLPPGGQLAADEIPDLRPLVRRAHERLEPSAPGGQFVKDGDVEVAVERQAQRAGDGGGGHHQQVRVGALAHQLLALRDAELMLLVNDHQPQAGQGKARRQQRVRAEGQPRRARGASGARFAAAGSEFHRHAQRRQPAGEIREVLLRQDLGGGHERDAIAAFQRHQAAAGRDDGFAGADVALEQPPHGVGAGHIAAQLAQDAGLRAGQREAQPRQKGFDEPVIAGARPGAGPGGEVLPPKLNPPLQRQELLERQPPPGQFRLRRVVREVQPADGLGARGQRGDCGVQRPRRPGRANRVRELPERPPDQRAQPALRQPLGQRVDGGEAVKVDEVLLAVFADFGLRVVEGSGLEVHRFAERNHFLAHREVFLHERQVPPAAMQPRGAVIEDQLEDGAGVVLIPLDSVGDHPAPRGGRHAQLQPGDGGKVAAVFVPGRPMPQQVLEGANLQPGQLRGAFRADAGQNRDRLAQGRKRFVGGRSGHPGAP